MSWPGRPAKSLLALYKNRDGTFTDVTAASGLGVQTYGMGVAATADNDGKTSTSPRSAATACSTTLAGFASRT